MTDMTTTSVDAASVELERVRHEVALGNVDISALIDATAAVEAAKLVAAERERIAEVQATQAQIEEARSHVEWLSGPEHLESRTNVVADWQGAVAAVRQLLESWDRFKGGRAPHFRRLRALAGAGMTLPDGTTIDPRIALDVAITTPDGGTWSSDSLREDPAALLVEHARALHRGRRAGSDLVARLGTEYWRGTGEMLVPDDDDDDDGPRAA